MDKTSAIASQLLVRETRCEHLTRGLESDRQVEATATFLRLSTFSYGSCATSNVFETIVAGLAALGRFIKRCVTYWDMWSFTQLARLTKLRSDPMFNGLPMEAARTDGTPDTTDDKRSNKLHEPEGHDARCRLPPRNETASSRANIACALTSSRLTRRKIFSSGFARPVSLCMGTFAAAFN